MQFLTRQIVHSTRYVISSLLGPDARRRRSHSHHRGVSVKWNGNIDRERSRTHVLLPLRSRARGDRGGGLSWMSIRAGKRGGRVVQRREGVRGRRRV